MDGGVTVVVEVKTGRRPHGGWIRGRQPGARFRRPAIERRARAGRRIARAQRGPSRVDLIEVRITPGARRVELLHQRDVAGSAARQASLDGPARP